MLSPPSPFPSSAGQQTSITTDFLALVGFAARLSACVNNDNTTEDNGIDSKSIKDEAMLLMSLLMGDKAEEILSDVKDSRCEKKRKVIGGMSSDCNKHSRPTDKDMNFSFTFPSLSLQPDDDGSALQKNHAELGVASENNTTKTDIMGAAQQADNKDEEDEEAVSPPAPSQLLGRTQCVHDKDMIRDSSESMAHNVLESFGAALVWRAKTWIKSLATVLALKEQTRIDALKSNNNTGEESDIDGGGGYVDDDNNENDELMNSKEMQIIDAIVKSSEEVSVVNVKTSFRVLSNRVSRQNSGTISIMGEEEPVSKKAKKEDGEVPSPQDVNEYKVTHKLIFEATVSMTSNDGVRYNGVKLQAPGYIQGTFTNKVGSTTEGEETLRAVSMTIDTDALAQSLERQSRLVVRRAAEAALMVASGVDCSSSPHYMDSPHVHHSIISPRYVLMSPVAPDRSSATMLPPIPSGDVLNGDRGSEGKATTTVVSSSEGGCSSDSSAATTPTISPTKEPKAPQSPQSFPALLSVANKELTRGE